MFGLSQAQGRADHYQKLWMDACNKNEELRRERDDLLHTTALMVETIDQQRNTISELEKRNESLQRDVNERYHEKMQLLALNSELEQANTALEAYLQDKMDPTCVKAEEAAQAWDNFLQRHEDELVNLRRISKERKAEVAKLNQQLADAKWVEDSLRYEIGILNHRVTEAEQDASYYYNLWNEVRQDHQDLSQQFAQREQNPMCEVRQAHQEAEQWQRRYEEAQESLNVITESLFGLRDTFQFSADDLSELFVELGLEGSEEEVVLDTFQTVSKTYISGEEIEAAFDRHWRERDR